ncbi:hypothetical protein, partial [Salmonella enterica]|uniref:hypothetical protein n=1 Tax=Salmonella enterica TaxID=28901 RepID=UPI003D35446A
FFYIHLVAKHTTTDGRKDADGQWNVEQCRLILESYGLDRYIAYIEAHRQYWRDGEHIISEILDFAAGAGFSDIWSNSGLNLNCLR